jgi:sterol desaturase/sphingolipid hydroxylase (fatty acid hydroxylase superfamily)
VTTEDVRDARPVGLWVRAAVIAGAFAGIVLLELVRPLRREVEGRGPRLPRNLAVAGLAALTVHLAEAPVVEPLARRVHARRLGLLPRLGLPGWVETCAGILLLDYTLYAWHVLTHKVPALWRFHAVHHADLDMDASTAVRFHFGELAVSIPWRAAQVAAIGVSPRTLSIWQTGLLVAVLFHHSNLRLPVGWERRLSRVLVTPRMHGIHHSIVQDEADSNWSSGLSIWDWLHGTIRLNVPQAAIDIGVAAYRTPEDVTLPRILVMPFDAQPDTSVLPGGGQPHREPASVPAHRLLP